jgi:CRP/FNR family transcriptional regulator, cyclic AMP receptor protein
MPRQTRPSSVARAVRSRQRPMVLPSAAPAQSIPADAASLLARCIIFQALDVEGRRDLARSARRRRYTAGQPIFHVGDPGKSLMAVEAGTVRISLPTRQGREVLLADVGPGDVFGEIALLDGRERSASAIAATNCSLLVLDRPVVMAFLRSHPDACLRLMEFLCARIRRSDDRMLDLGFSDIPARLAKTVANLASPSGRVSLSQADLAAMIGASRENVNRHLREWQRYGVIAKRRGGVIVLNPDKLHKIATEA